MSGTSADGIDAVLVQFDAQAVSLLGSLSTPFSSKAQSAIHTLADSQECTLEQLGELDAELGVAFASAALALIQQQGLQADQITAIGSHGQTVRHRPPGGTHTPFSLQIGDASIIAEHSKVTTVADFRRRDIAAGGQGAPLTPAFHQWALSSPSANRVIINIGGMSNITWLPSTGDMLGYDLGPGNVLMDGWIQRHLGQSYDRDGQWAATGRVDTTLLARLLKHPFLSAPAPKSTGREAFNAAWLQQQLTGYERTPAENIQATLCELTAKIVTDTCLQLDSTELYLCGGGAHNSHLLSRLRQLLPNWSIDTTTALGIDPDWVEAMAFAWLARETLARRSIDLRSVTGAKHPVVLGSVHY